MTIKKAIETYNREFTPYSLLDKTIVRSGVKAKLNKRATILLSPYKAVSPNKLFRPAMSQRYVQRSGPYRNILIISLAYAFVFFFFQKSPNIR